MCTLLNKMRNKEEGNNKDIRNNHDEIINVLQYHR